MPEILRSNLANTVLYLKALGVVDVMGFDFIDTPDIEQLAEALVVLHVLGALHDDGSVTQVGRIMSEFPVEPTTSRMLVTAARSHPPCFLEVAAIAAMTSSEVAWVSAAQVTHNRRHQSADMNVVELRNVVEERHNSLTDSRGDHLTMLKLFKAYEAAGDSHSKLERNPQQRWCEDHFIRIRSMQSAVRIRDQLVEDAVKVGLWPVRKGVAEDRMHASLPLTRVINHKSVNDAVCHSIASGLFMNVARRCGTENIYKSIPLRFPTLTNTPQKSESMMLHAHPNSVLGQSSSTTGTKSALVPSSRSPDNVQGTDYVVFQDLVFGGKMYMRNVQAVSSDSLRELRSGWTTTHPLCLSGRSAPLQDMLIVAGSQSGPAPIINKKRLIDQLETGGDYVDSMATTGSATDSSSVSVSAARARYLARKK